MTESHTFTVYHGTNHDFEKFEQGRSNGWSKPRLGHYFTDDFDVASEFGKVREYTITLNNPADFTEGSGDDIVDRVLEHSPALKQRLAPRLSDDKGYRGWKTYRLTNSGDLQTEEFIGALQALGYDGMIFHDMLGRSPFTSYVVFDGSAIHSG